MSAISKSWLSEAGHMNHVDLSIVIPVYNERTVLPLLYG